MSEEQWVSLTCEERHQFVGPSGETYNGITERVGACVRTTATTEDGAGLLVDWAPRADAHPVLRDVSWPTTDERKPLARRACEHYRRLEATK